MYLQEEIGKEIEDKKTELEPKVVEAYEASPPEVKVNSCLSSYQCLLGPSVRY